MSAPRKRKAPRRTRGATSTTNSPSYNTVRFERLERNVVHKLYQAELVRLTLEGKHLTKADKVLLIADAVEQVKAIAQKQGRKEAAR
jgi:hypothetical protein